MKKFVITTALLAAGALAAPTLWTGPTVAHAEPADGKAKAAKPAPAKAAAKIAPEAEAVYKKNCKKCHGMDGKGETAMGKRNEVQDWTTPEYQKAATDEQIAKVIAEGWVDPENPKRKMKGSKDKLSKAELDMMLQVVRACATPPGPFPN